jgi:hypothetical protein
MTCLPRALARVPQPRSGALASQKTLQDGRFDAEASTGNPDLTVGDNRQRQEMAILLQ